jgi:Family of unknown function (DUF5636)
MPTIKSDSVENVAEFLDANFVMGKLVLGEFEHVFNNKKTYMTQYAQMAAFLSDPEQVKSVCDRLSEYLCGMYVLAKDVYQIKGAFTEVLRLVAPQLGFSSDVVIMNGQLDGETFSRVVFNKQLFRDVFTRPHGEFTHAIQWMLLALRFGKEYDVPTLYKYSIVYKSKIAFSTGKASEKVFMWQFLVDCFEGAEDYKTNIQSASYRCPQYTTNNLHTLTTHSWLGNFLYARRQKGLKEGKPNPQGGHYGNIRTVTMPQNYVDRTVSGQPAYDKVNDEGTVLRKSVREYYGGYVQNGPTHPSSSSSDEKMDI